MAFEEPVEKYSGSIREVVIGSGERALKVGGENAVAFYKWEGRFPNPVAIAMEVHDVAPEDWADAVVEPLKDVLNDPAKWARKCQDEFDADAIALQLAGTDPNGADRSPDEAAATVNAVLGAVDVPVIVYGSGNREKDAEVLKKVAEATEGKNLIVGVATEDNYKPVAAAALGYKHNVSAETPIDVNMAKQLNILMTQLGLDASKIVIDPSTGALGYGLEYTYTVIERLRLAGLTQNDDMTQMPIISNLGKEAWRSKEAKTPESEEPAWGDAAKRGILWETITALSIAVAGGNIVVMRHPESVKLLRQALEGLAS